MVVVVDDVVDVVVDDDADVCVCEAGSKHCGLGASTGPTRGDCQSAMFQVSVDRFKGENKDKSSVA